MIEISTITIPGPVIGAVIAGIIGLFTQEYIAYIQQYKSKQEWYDRLDRLANRLIIDIPTDTELEGLEEENLETLRQQFRRYIEVYPLLEDHIADAPPECPQEVFDALDSLFEHHARYQGDITVPGEDYGKLQPKRRDADEIADDAARLSGVASQYPRKTKLIQLRGIAKSPVSSLKRFVSDNPNSVWVWRRDEESG
ncbi:hypothetical protein [Halomontanus rarus]|uniref:hypothetical protein n=1 Tax=Halomontanus rarus TaxID=3034020 RepID=UPI0023E8DEC3|nr:hypothetical protein [Halovivax sp. TS33]